jgi:DNA-binding response OmpR family regulator
MEEDVASGGPQNTILIVDDDTVLRDMYSRKLAMEGFKVLEAHDGTSGIEIAINQRPDLILLDIRMPEMSGFEMLKRLRSRSDWGAHVPVIFLTNLEPGNDKESADIESTEPAYYLIKSSTNLESLTEKVREVLGIS